jgi:hypothetical protein
MRKVLPILIGVLLLACKTEMDVDRADESTFIRYFGSENNNIANLALEVPTENGGGYTLLSTIETATDNFGHFTYEAQLIHTDEFGNLDWVYPERGSLVKPAESATGGKRPSSFIVTDNGYLVIGESINSEGISKLLLMEVSFDGALVRESTFGYQNNDIPQAQLDNISLKGRAVTVNGDGNYLVLADIINNTATPDDMFVAAIKNSFDQPSPFSWFRSYGAGSGQLVNKLFITTEESKLLWGGSVTIGGKSDMRIIKGPQDAQQTDAMNPIGLPDVDELAGDLCEGTLGYAFTGSTKSGQDNDIYFARVSKDAENLLSSNSFHFSESLDGTDEDLNEEGVSICPGVGNAGFAILANVESGSKGYGGTDLYLIKVNDLGTKQWDINYGGADSEVGASILATSDGYLIFGTSSFGNLKKLVLMKVNSQGQF